MHTHHAQSSSHHSTGSGIICTHGTLSRYVISVGWDRKLTFFEDVRLKEVRHTRQVPAGHREAHSADILAAALMEESTSLVTAADDGTLRVWSVESGALRCTLEAPGLQTLPEHRRAVEVLVFMHGARLKHVCVAVGGDQVARFWDIKHGVLLHQHFTGVLSYFCPFFSSCAYRDRQRHRMQWNRFVSARLRR